MLRGYFKNCGHENSAALVKNEIPHLSDAVPLKVFSYNVKELFVKVDTTKPKNQKSLRVAFASLRLSAHRCYWQSVGAVRNRITCGATWENPYCESFNGKLEDECLNGEIFYSLKEAQIVIEKWQVEYDPRRPHSALWIGQIHHRGQWL